MRIRARRAAQGHADISRRFVPPASHGYARNGKRHNGRMWVQNQRNSWHGVSYPYNGQLDIAENYERYAETLRGVDDSVGRVRGLPRRRTRLAGIHARRLHGRQRIRLRRARLIDKRTAYEESMRVPMWCSCPELFRRRPRR